MGRYLVVANQTLGGEHLIARIRERMSTGPSHFHIVVPATPPSERATWTEGEAISIAQERLDRALGRLAALGADASGEVGDGDPLMAIEDALRGERFDEIILSTLPPGPSRWLKLDLPNRVRERFAVAVTHLIGEAEAVTTDRSATA
jgi:hypothetical protein